MPVFFDQKRPTGKKSEMDHVQQAETNSELRGGHRRLSMLFDSTLHQTDASWWTMSVSDICLVLTDSLERDCKPMTVQ